MPSKPKSHPGYILVPGAGFYGNGENYEYETPQQELKDGYAPGWHWHWKWGKWGLAKDNMPRRLLFSWNASVFGEGTATITRKIPKEYWKESNFAFVLSSYRELKKPIPFSQLQLGTREHQHYGLIRLDEKILAAFDAANGKNDNPKGITSDVANIEATIEAAVNPHKAPKQGFGLKPNERKCVELHAMERAVAHLQNKGFHVEDVSLGNPFDLRATRNGKTVSVEVKGTTTPGAKILLTRKEVRYQKKHHPDNMLIVVHSISLKKGTEPTASGGKLRLVFPWPLQKENLRPYAYSYLV